MAADWIYFSWCFFQSGKNLASLVCASAPSAPNPSSSSAAEDDDEESTPKTAVEAVLFSTSETNQLITGTLEGTVTVWDISTHVSWAVVILSSSTRLPSDGELIGSKSVHFYVRVYSTPLLGTLIK